MKLDPKARGLAIVRIERLRHRAPPGRSEVVFMLAGACVNEDAERGRRVLCRGRIRRRTPIDTCPNALDGGAPAHRWLPRSTALKVVAPPETDAEYDDAEDDAAHRRALETRLQLQHEAREGTKVYGPSQT